MPENKHEKLMNICIGAVFAVTALVAVYKAIEEVPWFMCSKYSPFHKKLACIEMGGDYYKKTDDAEEE